MKTTSVLPHHSRKVIPVLCLAAALPSLAGDCSDAFAGSAMHRTWPPASHRPWLTNVFSVIEDYSIHRLGELTPSRVKPVLQARA